MNTTNVTEQQGDQPLITLCRHNKKICGEGYRFLLTRFPICGDGSISAPSWWSRSLPQSRENQWPSGRLKFKSTSRSFPLGLIRSPRLLLKGCLSLQLQILSLVPTLPLPPSSSWLCALLSVCTCCSQGNKGEAVQDACVLLHRVIAS